MTHEFKIQYIAATVRGAIYFSDTKRSSKCPRYHVISIEDLADYFIQYYETCKQADVRDSDSEDSDSETYCTKAYISFFEKNKELLRCNTQTYTSEDQTETFYTTFDWTDLACIVDHSDFFKSAAKEILLKRNADLIRGDVIIWQFLAYRTYNYMFWNGTSVINQDNLDGKYADYDYIPQEFRSITEFPLDYFVDVLIQNSDVVWLDKKLYEHAIVNCAIEEFPTCKFEHKGTTYKMIPYNSQNEEPTKLDLEDFKELLKSLTDSTKFRINEKNIILVPI